MSIFGLICPVQPTEGAMTLKKTKKASQEKYPLAVRKYKSFDEDFDGENFSERKIDKSYKYIKDSILHRLWAAALLRLVFTPAGLIYSKFVVREKFYGKEKLRAFRGKGKFIYANHTQAVADAFSPHVLTLPECAYTIISSKNFNLPVLGRLLPALGGLPLPTELSAARNFSQAIKRRISDGRAVVIFPEGHLWPYCSFVRPFSEGSFDYPIRLDCPSFAMTRVFVMRGGKVCSDVYVDGPFYPDSTVSPRGARAKLSAEIRAAMEERLKLSDLEVIRYEPDKADGK